MSNRSPGGITLLPWWLWIILMHLVFITLTGAKIFNRLPEWLKPRSHALSLVYEHNYAVWWSGFCLMLAGILFYRLASLSHITVRDKFMWLLVAVVTLGLSADEVGSVHERAMGFGGWWGLLPFAVLGTLAFGYAIGRMVLNPDRRFSALLICVSLMMFFAVAGLEYLEHAVRFKHYLAKSRFILEEGVELMAGFLLILAAILQIRKSTGTSISGATIVVAPASLIWVRHVLFFGLILHLLACIFWAPLVWAPRGTAEGDRGNPAFWYPMFVFVLAAFHCAFQAGASHTVRTRILWVVGLLIFLGLSTGQMSNHGNFISGFTELMTKEMYSGYYARVFWTTLPPLLFVLFMKPGLWLAKYLLLLLFLIYLLNTGRFYFEAYYLLSGFVAYLSFFLLHQSTPRGGNRNEQEAGNA